MSFLTNQIQVHIDKVSRGHHTLQQFDDWLRGYIISDILGVDTVQRQAVQEQFNIIEGRLKQKVSRASLIVEGYSQDHVRLQLGVLAFENNPGLQTYESKKQSFYEKNIRKIKARLDKARDVLLDLEAQKDRLLRAKASFRSIAKLAPCVMLCIATLAGLWAARGAAVGDRA